MSEHERGQVTRSAAEIYEEFFVPALFREWGDRVADAAGIAPGQRVLDVACGTGVLARAAAERTGPGGSVVGVDLNEGMLQVAARTASAIEWRRGAAESLPFESESFDAVVSQFALMFFADRGAGLREMARVLRPSGRLTVAVWAALDTTPGYSAVVELLKQLFGDDVADALRAPFLLGDRPALASLFADAGVPDAEIATREGTARFPSIASWMFTDVKGWTLAERLDDADYARLLAEAERRLGRFVADDGTVAFPISAHLVTATKRGEPISGR